MVIFLCGFLSFLRGFEQNVTQQIQTLQGQTMDEVKQPLVLERVQSIALQTRSSFGTPTGYTCFDVSSR